MNQADSAEYERLTAQIGQREQQIVQLFIAALTVSVTVLAAVAALAFDSTDVGLLRVYSALAPTLIAIPAASLLVNQRRDVVRLGTYCEVFLPGNFEARLGALRRRKRSEANDPMMWALWAITVAACVLFIAGLLRVRPEPSYLHYGIAPVAAVSLLAIAHWRWHHIVPHDRAVFWSTWQQIRDDEAG